MINLIPTELKQELMYARRNTVLARWAAILLIALAGAGTVVLGGQIFLQRSINSYSKQLASDRTYLKEQKLDETTKQLEDISSSVKLVVQVLSREVLFSKLLKQLAKAIPANAALLELNIEKLQGGVEIRAGTLSIQDATQLQLNLQDPANQIFEKADIENITCAPTPTSKYPCIVKIRALFSKNNPFLFINNSAKKAGANP